MATRDANGRFVSKKSRLYVDGVAQRPINVETAVTNYAQAAMNAPEGPAKRFWTDKLWETRNNHKFVTKLPIV